MKIIFFLFIIILYLNNIIICANIKNGTNNKDLTSLPSPSTIDVKSFESKKRNIDEDDDGPIRISLPTIHPTSKTTLAPTTTTTKAPTTIKAPTTNSASSTIKIITKQTTKLQQTKAIKATTKTIKATTQKTTKKMSTKRNFELVCPKEEEGEFILFPLSCTKNSDCKLVGKDFRCCKSYGSKRCLRGKLKPLVEQKHEPLLGLIPRKCPTDTLAETFWGLETCESDQNCWPRICCPDGKKKYCRTAKPELESIPAARQLSYPIQAISGYLQCTKPPPKVFDTHPKVCNNTLDCFPNVCCQEAGKKHCRPPKRSLLALLTSMTQRFNTGIIKQWTDNLVIR